MAEKADSCDRCIHYSIITLLLLSTWPLVSKAQVEEEYNNIVSMNVLIIVGYSSIMHVMFLLLNWIAAGFLGLSSPVKKTVVILGSHKALSFALKVLKFLTTNVGSRRLMSIVCVIAYLTLLVLDSMIVCKWATITDDETEEDKSKQNGNYGTLPQDSDWGWRWKPANVGSYIVTDLFLKAGSTLGKLHFRRKWKIWNNTTMVVT